jgi:hypothetical protein
MASHTQAELQRAARVLGESARALELGQMGSVAADARWETQAAGQLAQEPEPDAVEAAIEREAFPARRRGVRAPFVGDWDLEPDIWEPQPAEEDGGERREPFDLEHEPLSGHGFFEALPELAEPLSAPFDFERELSRDVAA